MLAVGARVGDALHRAAIAVVAGEQRAASDFFRGGAGMFSDAKQWDRLGDDGGGIQEDKKRNEFAVHERVGRREQRIEQGGDAGAGGGVGFAHASESELPGAKERETELGGLLRVIETRERIDDLRLKMFFADTRERDEGFDGGLRIFFFERALRPVGGKLALDGSAGGKTDKAVGAGEVRPSDGDGFGTGTFGVEGFEAAAELSLGSGRKRSDGRGVFRAGISNPIERGLSAAATNREIHRTVAGVNHDVGEWQRFTGDEFFFFGGERGPTGLKVHRVERAVGPIGGEEGALVFSGEFSPGAENGTRRRAGADVDDRG